MDMPKSAHLEIPKMLQNYGLTICDALCDLVSFVQFKNINVHEG